MPDSYCIGLYRAYVYLCLGLGFFFFSFSHMFILKNPFTTFKMHMEGNNKTTFFPG